MSELLSSQELLSNEHHARTVAEEINRILTDVPVRNGLTGYKNHSARNKTRWHNNLLFFEYPEGESNVDDSTVTNLAIVCYDNPDGSRHAYTVEQAQDGAKQLSRTIYPGKESPLRLINAFVDTPEDMFDITLKDLAVAQAEQISRIEERKVGAHLAAAAEAEELIERLQETDPAPAARP